MFVRIKRVDEALSLPAYMSEGSVAFDFPTREGTVIEPGKIGLIPCNAIIAIPKGYALLLTLRSSVPTRYGLIMPNAPGIIDHSAECTQDYCGPNDEIMAQVVSLRAESVIVPRGARIVQGMFVRIRRAVWLDFEPTPKGGAAGSSRSGFGSTGC